MDENQKQKLIQEDEDFVCLKRYGFSLKRVLERFPEGASDRIVAQALGITEAEVQENYSRIIQKLKKNF